MAHLWRVYLLIAWGFSLAMLNNQMIYSNSSGFIPPIFDDPIFDDLYHPFTVNLGMRIVIKGSWEAILPSYGQIEF
jgi:hypothetical protein